MSGWRYAFSLSKQEVATSKPPGTVTLIDRDYQYVDANARRSDGNHVALIPMPTRNPADPLVWSKTRRYSILAALSFFAFAADFATGVIAPALPIMAYQILPPQPFSQLSKLVSINNLMFGLSNIVWVPMSNIVGRRPVLLASSLLFVFASMWGGLATSFTSLLASRAVQGIGAGSAYAVAPDVLGEIFFVHERGRAMAVYTSCLATASFVGGIAGGYIAGKLGYQYTFWVSTALAAFTFLAILVAVPETLFDRGQHLDELQRSAEQTGSTTEKAANVMLEYAALRQEPVEYGVTQSMGLWSSYRGNVVRNFIRPWLTLRFPGTWVVMLQYGSLVGGVVALATVGPTLLAMPPYLWGEDAGLINIGGLIGAFLGGLMIFVTADLLIKWRAKKETHGFSECETRLPLVLPGIFLAVTGTWTFGFSAANPSPHAWAGLVVGSGMHAAGLTMVPSVGFNYLIEAYHAVSGDCFVMVIILRSVVAFAWVRISIREGWIDKDDGSVYFIAEWTQSAGPALPFGLLGMLIGVFGILVVPLWLFGKRARIATAKFLPDQNSQ